MWFYYYSLRLPSLFSRSTLDSNVVLLLLLLPRIRIPGLLPLDSNVVLLLLFGGANRKLSEKYFRFQCGSIITQFCRGFSKRLCNFRFQCGSIITMSFLRPASWNFIFRFQCGSIITQVAWLFSRLLQTPLDSNVVLLLL